MSGKIARIFALILQAICTVFLLGICLQGFFLDTYRLNHIEFAECAIRIIFISVFTMSYYHSLAGGFGSDTFFIPVHLFFSVLSEARILNTFSSIFHTYLITPVQIVNIFILSTIMTVLPLIGYCLFFDSPSSDSAIRFILFATIGTILLTSIIPKPQNYSNITDCIPVQIVIYGIYIIAFIVCIAMLFTDTPGPTLVRHIICLILVIGNYINLFFNTFIMNLVGTAFLISACIIIMIMTKRNAIKL